MDDDVAVISSERFEVVHIAGQNDASAEPDGRRDHRGIDDMTRVEAVEAQQSARRTSDPMVERNDAIAAPDDTVDRRIPPRASVGLRQYGGRDSNEGVAEQPR